MLLKLAGSRLDYPVTYELADGETIQASAWAVAPVEAGGLVVVDGSKSIAGATARCLVEGGLAGHLYNLQNVVTTDQGRALKTVLTVRVAGAVSTDIPGGVDLVNLSLAVIDATDTLTASARTRVAASLNIVDADDVLTASLVVANPGSFSLNIVDGNDTLTASAAVRVLGSLNVTDAEDTLTGYISTVATFQLVTDGMWTWYNDPRAVVSEGVTYVGTISGNSSGGDVQLSKLASGAVSTTQLANNLQVDDHDNPGLVVLPGGKIAAFYSHHSGDTVGMRYRVSSNALPDISSFAAEVQVANGGIATGYCQVSLLNDGIVRVVQRSGNSTERTWQFVEASAADVEAGTASWTRTTILRTAGARPYVLSYKTAANRIDFLVTNGHPNETATSLYHIYMQLDGGTERWYKSDGTEIVSGLPIDITTSGTLIQNTTGGRCWNWALKLGADGYPRVLATRYPSSTGARDIVFSDIEYWHYRWTGTAWTGFPIASGQTSLYPNENHYAGGLCFDGNTTDRLYMALVVDGIYEISEWAINETAQAVSKLRQITSGSTYHNIRPYSPEGYMDAGVFWNHGPYTTYQNYSMGTKYAEGGGPLTLPPPPVNATLPVISGTAQQGQTLTASTGTWTNTPTSFTYQWKADAVNISGATSSSYLLTGSEVGKVITVTVTAANAGGSGSATSSATSTVAAAPAWSPSDWTNLVAWWDFNDNATVFSDTAGTTPATAGSSAIGRVNDKKGAAHLTEASARPSYVTDGSRKVAQFTQSSIHKLTSGDATLASVADGNDNAWAMVAAVKRTTGASLTADIAAFVRKGVQNDRHRIAGITTTGRLASIRTANSVDVSADTNPATPMSATGSWAIVTVVFAGTSVVARVNGAVVLSAVALDTSALTINEFVMGAYYVHTTGLYQNGWQGMIGEMFVADEGSVTSNVTYAEAYLASRFGVTLP